MIRGCYQRLRHPGHISMRKSLLQRRDACEKIFYRYLSSTNNLEPLAPAVPQEARVVICGGGIIGSSVAYHLSEQGWTDVVVLEQGR